MHNCFVLLSHRTSLALSFSLSCSEYILNISLIISFSLSLFWVHPIAPISLCISLAVKNPLNCNANYKLKISPFVVLLRLSLYLCLSVPRSRSITGALSRSGFDFDLIVCVCCCCFCWSAPSIVIDNDQRCRRRRLSS